MNRETKRDFIAWLRTHRAELCSEETESAAAMELLGLDDATLAAWEESSSTVLTTPHASPNVFGQRIRVGWAASSVQRIAHEVHHVRVVLTHTNMSDLGWRPYAWWTLDHNLDLQVTRIFSRNKKRKHTVPCALPSLKLDPATFHGVDAEAAKHARWGRDLATSLILVMATIEREAGLAIPGRTSYVPLNLVMRYIRQRSSLDRSFDRLLRQGTGRALAADGQLVPAETHDALIYDNPTNLASLAVLGDATMLGGSKMMSYWADVDRASNSLIPGLRPVRPFVVPEIDLDVCLKTTPTLMREIAKAGIDYSQGMALAEHGAFALEDSPFDLVYLRRLGMDLLGKNSPSSKTRSA